MMVGVCTLFEGSYGLGMAALVNSLAIRGFKGPIYVGYRGGRPSWPQEALLLCGIQLEWCEIETSSHLANIKPSFMLDVLARDQRLTHLCYFDPDIVLISEWKYIEEWLTCGVALCADVNSPLSPNHPRRVGWSRHLAKLERIFLNRSEEYVNAGFVGISRDSLSFLQVWQILLAEIADIIGGLEVTKVVGGQAFESKGFASCLDCPDQDALNAVIAIHDAEISIVGKDGMGFESGTILMFHAIGRDKPWERQFLKFALAGVPPRACDKEFFRNLRYPIRVPISGLRWKRISLAIATVIGRVWRRAA